MAADWFKSVDYNGGITHTFKISVCVVIDTLWKSVVRTTNSFAYRPRLGDNHKLVWLYECIHHTFPLVYPIVHLSCVCMSQHASRCVCGNNNIRDRRSYQVDCFHESEMTLID